MSLAAPSVGVGCPRRVTGVCTGGGLVGLVHQSVDGVEVLMAAAALGRSPLTAAIAAGLRATRSSVAALTLDPAGRHWLLVRAVL